MDIHPYRHACMHTQACIPKCTHTYTRTSTSTHTHTHTYTHTRAGTHARERSHMQIRTRTHARTRALTRRRVCTHTDTDTMPSVYFVHAYLISGTNVSNLFVYRTKSMLAKIVKATQLKPTDLPMYQYSKHFEKSLYIDSLQTGASAKANLVFHPDGYLPKTAMVDMTAQIMGVPIALVETVVGIDGIESLVEYLSGPDVTIPQDFVFKMFNWTMTPDTLKKMAQKRGAKNRERREVSDDLLNDLHDPIDRKPTRPSGFMSLKVMGQEMRFMSYDDIYAMIDQIDNMNVVQLLRIIAKGGKKTFTKSMMFLEMTHTVPTGLGLPLKLKLTGSTVGSVELNGKFDIRNMFWGPAGVNINGFVKPSAVVEVSGKMGIESNYVSTGLLVSSNMMVSNMMKGSIQYQAGRLLKINLDTPSEPVQLFKFS